MKNIKLIVEDINKTLPKKYFILAAFTDKNRYVLALGHEDGDLDDNLYSCNLLGNDLKPLDITGKENYYANEVFKNNQVYSK